MINRLNIQDPQVAASVLNVQIPAYQVEAALIGTDEIPPLKDTVATLQQSGETFYGLFEKEELCGVLSFKADGDIIDIHRLVVHPQHFRKKIAQQLLDHLESQLNPSAITVATGSKNDPAVQFYLKNGFQKINEVQLNDVLSLTFFHKLF